MPPPYGPDPPPPSHASITSTIRPTPFGTFVYHHLKTDLFWGYGSRALAGGRTAFVATPEKALLDPGYLRSRSDEPAFARGLRLQRLDAIDFDRLANMSGRFGSRKVERFARNVAALAAAEKEEWGDL